jgi:pyruvate-formate lyase-activating enzyme
VPPLRSITVREGSNQTATIPFRQEELTVVGRRRRALLDSFEPFARDALGAHSPWRLVDVESYPPGFRFETVEGRAFVLQLKPRRELLSFAATRHFKLTYKLGKPGDAPEQPVLRALVAALIRWEEAAASNEEFPALVFDRRADAVTYSPQDRQIEIRPTLACNHHCGFCNSVDRSITNAFHGANDVLDSIPLWEQLGIEQVVITGGEPTLLKNLADLIAALNARHYRVRMQTHGMALAEPGFARRLRELGLESILVSLHSADAKLSDSQITHFEGGWEKTVAGITAALDAGLAVEISHVVHRANIGDTAAFMRFVHERWQRRLAVRLAYVAPTGMSTPAILEFVPPIPDALPELRAALAIAREHDLRVRLVAYCGVPPCLLTPYEEYSEVPYRAPTSYSQHNHVKLEACRECVYATQCPGVWRGYIETYGDPGVTTLRTRISRSRSPAD